MIIKLMKADFSEHNIGTLDTWSIITILGTGATSSSNITSVDKEDNTGYSTTITIAEGYELLQEGGVEVKMGSSVLTSGITISEDRRTITISIGKVDGNVSITVRTSGSGSGGGGGGTPDIPDTFTLLTKNGNGVSTFSRLAASAYVANMKQMFAANSTIGYIEFPLVTDKILTTVETTIPEITVWVFNAETNTPMAKIIDAQSYTSTSSDSFGSQTIKININRTFDYPFYFGYSNKPSANNTALAYYSESGNYLSGNEFIIGNTITQSSSPVAVYCSIYGEGSLYEPIIPDDVDKMTQIALYNDTANSVLAGNCYVANKNQTVAENTLIKILDIMAMGGTVKGLNVYVVNANTDTITEMLANEQTIETTFSSKINSDVVRLTVNKTYNYPIYFMFNSERISGVGLKMANNATGSILKVDDEVKPAVGDVLSDFTSYYNVGHAIYN